MSCCPPGSHGFLQSQGPTKGTVNTDFGAECYVIGSGSVAVIFAADVWGFNSGRIRMLADALAEKLGVLCVVPKMLQPPLEGGTDGDGLPPGFDVPSRLSEMFAHAGQHWAWKESGPVFMDVVAKVSQKCPKIGVVGFCWGGYTAIHAAQKETAIACAAICHPSCHIESMMGGDLMALVKGSTFPFALYPAGEAPAPDAEPTPAAGDPAMYDEGGEFFAILNEKFPGKCETYRYKEQAHGFVTRGSLPEGQFGTGTGDAVDKAIADCVHRYSDYLKRMLL